MGIRTFILVLDSLSTLSDCVWCFNPFLFSKCLLETPSLVTFSTLLPTLGLLQELDVNMKLELFSEVSHWPALARWNKHAGLPLANVTQRKKTPFLKKSQCDTIHTGDLEIQHSAIHPVGREQGMTPFDEVQHISLAPLLLVGGEQMAASKPNSLHNSGYGLFSPLFIKRRKILILSIALLTKVPKQRFAHISATLRAQELHF